MKTSSILFTFSIFLIHCSTARPLTSEHQQFKQVYIRQFKLTYFRKLLFTGFNNSEALKSILNQDKSSFTEPILTNDDYQFIDILVHQANEYMVADSVNNIGKVAEGAEGKRVLGYVLERVESKWLYRLAKSRYKLLNRKTF
jgi:hypothetical protein